MGGYETGGCGPGAAFKCILFGQGIILKWEHFTFRSRCGLSPEHRVLTLLALPCGLLELYHCCPLSTEQEDWATAPTHSLNYTQLSAPCHYYLSAMQICHPWPRESRLYAKRPLGLLF